MVEELQKSFTAHNIQEPQSSAEYIVAHACGQKTVSVLHKRKPYNGILLLPASLFLVTTVK
jgi:hypothetical protein